jgi:hypothetical protein
MAVSGDRGGLFGAVLWRSSQRRAQMNVSRETRGYA